MKNEAKVGILTWMDRARADRISGLKNENCTTFRPKRHRKLKQVWFVASCPCPASTIFVHLFQAAGRRLAALAVSLFITDTPKYRAGKKIGLYVA